MVYWIPRIITPNVNSSSNNRKVPTNESKQGNNAFNFELLSIGTESCIDNSKVKKDKKTNILNNMIGFE